MPFLSLHFWDFVTLFGYILEISGVVMMASRFLGVDVFSLIFGIYTAIFKSKIADFITDLGKDDDENVSRTLRGLSLLLWGFSFQFIAFFADKF
tara:strand:- start:11 stop:292 length:282 start_codon:yes stop_codon:yes gene_type:complete